MDTLLFCVENDIALMQVYLDYDLINSTDYLIEIRKFAKESDIILTCHAPEFLNEKLLDTTTLSAAQLLLAHQEEKKLVVHFDENETLKRMVAGIEAVNRYDMTVCLENFHKTRDEKLFLRNIDTYTSVFSVAEKYTLSVIPVIDFPRLFDSDIFNHYDSLVLCEQIVNSLALHAPKIILHCIDFMDYNHSNRNTWCALGKGLMPYKTIFEYAKQQGLSYDHCVLEYEDKKLTIESLEATELI